MQGRSAAFVVITSNKICEAEIGMAATVFPLPLVHAFESDAITLGLLTKAGQQERPSGTR